MQFGRGNLVVDCLYCVPHFQNRGLQAPHLFIERLALLAHVQPYGTHLHRLVFDDCGDPPQVDVAREPVQHHGVGTGHKRDRRHAGHVRAPGIDGNGIDP